MNTVDASKIFATLGITKAHFLRLAKELGGAEPAADTIASGIKKAQMAALHSRFNTLPSNAPSSQRDLYLLLNNALDELTQHCDAIFRQASSPAKLNSKDREIAELKSALSNRENFVERMQGFLSQILASPPNLQSGYVVEDHDPWARDSFPERAASARKFRSYLFRSGTNLVAQEQNYKTTLVKKDERAKAEGHIVVGDNARGVTFLEEVGRPSESSRKNLRIIGSVDYTVPSKIEDRIKTVGVASLEDLGATEREEVLNTKDHGMTLEDFCSRYLVPHKTEPEQTIFSTNISRHSHIVATSYDEEHGLRLHILGRCI